MEGPKNSEKAYLYHHVPDTMWEQVIHPLNTLRELNPQVYKAEAAKYEGREQVMDLIVPTLNAAWNDVVHLTAVHPAELKKALVEAGFKPKEMKFYQIDPESLDPKLTTIYLFRMPEGEHEEKFVPYDPKNVGEHATIPQTTKDYYREQRLRGEKIKLFVGVPHILHKGSIDVSKLPVISV